MTIERLVPESVFLDIMADYVDRVHCVLPLVHLPTFQTKLHARAYNLDSAFFRLCVALFAVTMASIPRQIETYGCRMFKDVGDVADRAAHLILASRMGSEPSWANNPTRETMIVSVIMSLASHYAGRVNAGWFFASEAVQYFRSLELFTQAAYAGLGPIDAEMSKRAFWILYIMQMSVCTPSPARAFSPLPSPFSRHDASRSHGLADTIASPTTSPTPA